MGKSFAIAALALALAATPADSGGDTPEQPDGMLVMGVASPERVIVADPRSGASRARRLPGGTLCHGPVLAVGGQVVFSGVRGGKPVALALPASMEGAARSLGPADAFLRSAVPDRLWLARWPGRPKRWSARPVRMELREVATAGRTTARREGLSPRFSPLEAAVVDGFVISQGRWLTLRAADDVRPLLRVRDGWFAAAGRSSFAWCRGGCDALHVWDRGEDRVLAPPPGMHPIETVGAFSPDERRLAVGVTVAGRPRVAIADIESGHWTVMPGARLGGYRALAWSPSGRWLYLTAANRRLIGWRLGAPRPERLPIQPRGTVMSIAGD